MTRRATKSLPLEVGEFEGGSEYDSLTSTRQNHGKGLRGGFKTITVHIKLPAAEPAFPRVGEIFFFCLLACSAVSWSCYGQRSSSTTTTTDDRRPPRDAGRNVTVVGAEMWILGFFVG